MDGGDELTVQQYHDEMGPESKEVDPRDGARGSYWGDDHVNPLFRPTVQKLYQKLWGMKILQNQDNRVHILNRLAVEMDPPHLAQLIHELTGRLWWKLGYIDAATGRGWPVLHFADAKWPWQWGPEPDPSLVGGALSLEPNPDNLDHRAAEKNAMLDVIKAHQVDLHESYDSIRVCTCKERFNTPTAWAFHLAGELDAGN